MKINTNQETIDEIKKVMETQSDRPASVRIFVAGHGCSGPSLGLALDEFNEEKDLVDESTGIKFIMDQSVFEQMGDVKVEFQGNGYHVAPMAQAESACGSCGGGCGH